MSNEQPVVDDVGRGRRAVFETMSGGGAFRKGVFRVGDPAWELWMRRHGVDPAGVPDGAVVIAVDEVRRVYVPGPPMRVVEGGGWSASGLITLWGSFQLEAPALSFPASRDLDDDV